jgi:D-alanine-D-alanine ligase
MAVRAFRVLGCAGLIRADFFVYEQGEATSIVLNEVNTLPGFTQTSWFPASWASAGLPYPRLLDVLVDTALAKGVRNRAAA